MAQAGKNTRKNKKNNRMLIENYWKLTVRNSVITIKEYRMFDIENYYWLGILFITFIEQNKIFGGLRLLTPINIFHPTPSSAKEG